jgi:outer membrane immunogenic protein
MKKLVLATLLTGVAVGASAQSAFEGFYGQIATGYESNQVSNINTTGNLTAGAYSASNQNFGGAPLVLGIGYNFSVAPKWLIGIGVDYSVLSQTSSTFSQSNPVGDGLGGPSTISGASMKASNRYNIFVTPGYEVDKDKLVYLKAGYSSVSATNNWPTTYSDSGFSGPITPALGSQSKTVSGYILGLGYKQMISSGLYAFAEGNYMSYTKPNFSVTSGNGEAITVSPSISSYQLLVGVGYRF